MGIGEGFNPFYGFGPFRIDPENRQLLRADQPVPLTPKAFDTLLLLVERSGRLVSKDDLMKAVWPDTFVSEANLTQTIFMVRKALGESASEQRFIVTVPGRGYRFAERVLEVADLSEGRSAPVATPTRPRRVVLVGTIATAAVLLAGMALYGFLAPVPAPRVLRLVPLVAPDRVVPRQELLSDGAHIYSLQRTGNEWKLMQTSVKGGGSSTLVAPFQHTRILSVSRDHAEFLVSNFDAPGNSLPLWIWTPGGSPARVGDILADSATWFPNGQEIAYVRHSDIRAVRRDGTGDRLLLHTAGLPGFLRWSPDGKLLSFTLGDARTPAGSIWVSAADGSNAHARFGLLTDADSTCCGDWTADGRYFLFTALHNGKSDLWALREKGTWFPWGSRKPVQLTSGATSIYTGLPLGNGDRILVYSDEIQIDTVRYDRTSGLFVPLVPDMSALDLAFSKDGKRIAFIRLSDRSLWQSRPDGSERAQLVGPPMRVGHPRWSPDGTKIAFEARLPGRPLRAYVVSAAGGPAQEVLPHAGMQSLPIWSPDGHSLAIALNVFSPADANLPRGIFVVDWRTRQAVKLAGSESLTAPLWSPDGKYLTTKTLDEKQILRFDPLARRWVEIARGGALSGPTWSRDSGSLYVQDLLEPGEPLYSLQAGTFRRVKFLSFESLLLAGFHRCAFHSLTPEGVPVVELARGATRVYAADLELP